MSTTAPWFDRLSSQSPYGTAAVRGAGVDGSRDRTAVTGAIRPWPLIGTIGLLGVVNLLNNVVAPDLYVLSACLAIVGLALLARADGLHRSDWGLGPVSRRAAVAALLLVAATAAVMLIGTQLGGVELAYRDQRVAGMSAGQVAFAALVRAPVGTALLEEVAFRGVLLAMLARRFGAVWGIAGSSLAFGVWHVVPSLGLAAGNAAIGSAVGGLAAWAPVIGVIAAGLAGTFLCLLRIRYDHLVAPLAVHATSNSLAYLLAWLMLAP
jgi:membrane protease YdiL (CAAX protease family)